MQVRGRGLKFLDPGDDHPPPVEDLAPRIGRRGPRAPVEQAQAATGLGVVHRTCLTSVDRDVSVRPVLAAASAPADETMAVWDFTLREGVRLHNGQEMAADDVVSSFKAHVAQRGSGFVTRWLKDVEATGRHGVRMHPTGGYAEWPHVVAEVRLAIWPAGEAETRGFDGNGTGPFRLIDVDNKRGFRAVRFEHYRIEGRPFAEELEGHIAASQTAINGFRAGQFDAVFNIDPTTAGQFRAAGGIVHMSPGGDQFLLIMPKNLDMARNDLRLRKALTFAIDRDAINRIVYGDPGTGVGNDTQMSGLNREFLPRPVAQDVDETRRLLAEAGFPNGVTLPTMAFCPSFPEEPRIIAIVAGSVRRAGITLDFRELPCDGLSDYGMAVNAPIGRPRRNLVGRRNPAINMGRMDIANRGAEPGGREGPLAERYSALYAPAVAEPDDAKRFALYEERQRIVQKDTPAIMLGGRRNLRAHRPEVVNLRSQSQNWSSRFYDFWIAG